MRLSRWLFRFLILALVLVLGAMLAAGAGLFTYYKPGTSAAPVTVLIARGTSTGDIARQLYTQQVFGGPPIVFLFGLTATGLRGQLQAGEYEFPPQSSMAQVAGIMASGQVISHKITVVEGMTVLEVIDTLKAESALDGLITSIPPEGTLLPETYFFSRGDSRMSLISRMQKDAADALQAVWASRVSDLPIKTPQEALTLASIIEKETGVSAERAKVGGVFINRLKQGMRLQSDPTAIYPLSHNTGNLGRELTRKDLETPSPYNTYTSDGLPPGPIANPGLAALKAATNPDVHDFLYFVADGSGGHAFAKTLDEHNRNVARWRQLQKP